MPDLLKSPQPVLANPRGTLAPATARRLEASGGGTALPHHGEARHRLARGLTSVVRAAVLVPLVLAATALVVSALVPGVFVALALVGVGLAPFLLVALFFLMTEEVGLPDKGPCCDGSAEDACRTCKTQIASLPQ